MKGKFQQLQTSRDLIFELNLNKQPKDCKNLSLIDAKNIQLNDSFSAITSYNANINYIDEFDKIFYNVIGSSEYTIIGTINCIDEIVFFIGNTRINDKMSYIDIYRYNIKYKILTNKIARLDYKCDCNTKIIGTYTYNVNEELIIMFSLFNVYNNSNLKIEQVPLHTGNLGKLKIIEESGDIKSDELIEINKYNYIEFNNKLFELNVRNAVTQIELYHDPYIYAFIEQSSNPLKYTIDIRGDNNIINKYGFPKLKNIKYELDFGEENLKVNHYSYNYNPQYGRKIICTIYGQNNSVTININLELDDDPVEILTTGVYLKLIKLSSDLYCLEVYDEDGNFYTNFDSIVDIYIKNPYPKLKVYPINPVIPEFDFSSKIINGTSKIGNYQFFIRFYLNKYDYTGWIHLEDISLFDEGDYKQIFTGMVKKDESLDREVVRLKVLNEFDIINKQIQFHIDLGNIEYCDYKYYQIGFICSNKTYTYCKISDKIFSNDCIIDFYNFKDYNIDDIIKPIKNYYNVKNICNYKNKIYIANYEEYIFNKNIYNLNEYCKTQINESEEENNVFRCADFYWIYLNIVNEYGEISEPIKIASCHSKIYEKYKLSVKFYGSLSALLSENNYKAFFSYSKNDLIKHCLIYNSTDQSCYGDSLNYDDSINLNINKAILVKEDHLFDIDVTNIKYLVAGSIEDDNEDKSTRITFNTNSDLSNYDGCTIYLYEDDYIYEKKDLCYKNTKISSYKQSDNIELGNVENIVKRTAIIANTSFRIDHYNRIKTNRTVDSIYKLSEYSCYDSIPYAIQINNYPQNYVTIINDVDYDNPDVKLTNSKIFLIQDTIDIFKNNALSFIEANHIPFLVNNDDKKYKFNNTIRRSNNIFDESLKNDWRTFETENYKYLIENKGEITKIINSGNILLIHTKHSLFQLNLDDTIIAQNKNIQLHSVDVFDVQYKEVFTSNNSYGGLKNSEHSIFGEFGYIFYSESNKRFMRYDNNSLITIDDNIYSIIKNIRNPIIKFGLDISNHIIITQINNIFFVYDYKINNIISLLTFGEENLNNHGINNFYALNSFLSIENDVYANVINTSNLITTTLKKLNNTNTNISSKFSIIINENYNKIKVLEYIKYKCYEKENYDKSEFRRIKSPKTLRVYNDLCDTGELDIAVNLKDQETYNDITKPTYDLGNFNMSYLRDKKTNSQIFGNYFIVSFTFDNYNFEFESLDYSISEK